MGLSVSVYKNCQIATVEEIEKYKKERCMSNLNIFKAYVSHPSFKDRIKKLNENQYYKAEYYNRYLDYSYGTHKQFRDYLMELLDLKIDNVLEAEKLYKKSPFYDFVRFPSFDGCIDWKTSKKLYKDFKRFENIFSIKFYLHKSLIKIYGIWKDILKEGKKKGNVVVFHQYNTCYI